MKNPIVFYDASCPFCSKAVRFILRHEKAEILKFSSLQGEYAKEFLSNKGIFEIDMSTFYFYNNDVLYTKSTAALRLLPFLKWYCLFFYLGWLIPRFIRDYFYDIVAKNRYKIFKDKCDFDFLSVERDLDKRS